MSRQVQPKRRYAKQEILQIAHPRGKYARVNANLSRENWPSGDAVKITFQVSSDNGLTWVEIGSSVEVGGSIQDRNGNVRTHSRISFSILNGATHVELDQIGDVRVVLDPLKPINTEVELEVLDEEDIRDRRN